METFKQALDAVIDSMIKLEAEWERIDNTHSDYLAEQYPLSNDWREIVMILMEWKDSL
ncbi:hypothetical protein M2277_000767 [Paenibacillus sp. LBL]|uniref:hypothetical protein n=1 Tax=Paenibacillus sp. LBL TaxID=2940563 RepID=UPI00247341FA|nr:hypothetical protein [Paenibacillus sp. LBL]MDH6670123.1 hypothetical protein [Paenibacillus sp. LBL]